MDTAALHPPLLTPEAKPKPGWAAWARLLGKFLVGAVVGFGTAWLVTRLFDLDGWALLGLFAAFAVFYWLHTVLHEAGHAIAGLAVGYKPLLFGLGPLRFERGGDGWFLRWGGWLDGVGGFAFMLPADTTPSPRREALYVLGGPLANLITGVPVLLLASTAPPGPWMVLGLGFGAAGLVMGVFNLLPRKAGTGAWLSDGAQLAQLYRSPGRTFDELRILRLLQWSMSGQRLRDMPTSLLPERPLLDPASDSPLDFFDVYVRHGVAIERGEAGRARDCARWLVANWPRTEPEMRNMVALSMVMHAALVEDDLALLQAWRPLVTDDALIDLSCYQAWLDAEIAFREGREAEAHVLLAKARAALPRIHALGTRVTVTEYLDALEARLSPRPVESPPAPQFP